MGNDDDAGDSRAAMDAKETTTHNSVGATKRASRMLHESSFSTSTLTSTKPLNRPPGFVASSLDFKASSVAPNVVTTKPGSNDKSQNNKQRLEQLEREKQYQQQRRYRSTHPTRAQGNYGPPPHSVKSLKDLENMTEEQIYKLFMEDPDLHEAFIKATENREGNDVPTSAPVGAQKARRSSRKPSSSSKAKRSTTKSRTLKTQSSEREIPYFQWCFIFVLIVFIIYRVRKAFSSPVATKDIRCASKNPAGKKDKKKKGSKHTKKTTSKITVSDEKVESVISKEDKLAAEKKSASKKKKKKKNSKTRETIQKKSDHHGGPDLDSTDSSNSQVETTKLDLAIKLTPDVVSTENEEDEAWQTVTKSINRDRKTKTTIVQDHIQTKSDSSQPVVEDLKEENNDLDQPSTEIIGDDDRPVDPEKETNKDIGKETVFIVKKKKTKKRKGKGAASNKKGDTSSEHPITKGTNESESAMEENDGKATNAIEEDAALALKLHEEEVNRAMIFRSNPQEDAWEEVTIKRKKI